MGEQIHRDWLYSPPNDVLFGVLLGLLHDRCFDLVCYGSIPIVWSN